MADTGLSEKSPNVAYALKAAAPQSTTLNAAAARRSGDVAGDMTVFPHHVTMEYALPPAEAAVSVRRSAALTTDVHVRSAKMSPARPSGRAGSATSTVRRYARHQSPAWRSTSRLRRLTRVPPSERPPAADDALLACATALTTPPLRLDMGTTLFQNGFSDVAAAQAAAASHVTATPLRGVFVTSREASTTADRRASTLTYTSLEVAGPAEGVSASPVASRSETACR